MEKSDSPGHPAGVHFPQEHLRRDYKTVDFSEIWKSFVCQYVRLKMS